jgi:hypothetical protein
VLMEFVKSLIKRMSLRGPRLAFARKQRAAAISEFQK